MSNPEELRCTHCGEVASPVRVGPGPGWLAIILWAGAGAVWTVGYFVAQSWLPYLGAVLFLGAFIYTLWYFYKREQACRHCGSRTLESST